MVEDSEPASDPRVIPANTYVETRMASAQIESIIGKHFTVTPAIEDRVKALATEIAVTMAAHYLSATRLFYGKTEGRG